MKDYTELINRLLAYAADRKGKIAELTEEAADAIKELAERFPDVKKTPDGDLISRKAVLDSLDYRQMKFAELGPEYFTALRKDIRTLPTVEREEWISIEKKLPPLKERVLVACYGRVCYGEMESADENDGYPLFSICDNVNARKPVVLETTVHGEMTKGRIKAWMPLPAPPTEGTK